MYRLNQLKLSQRIKLNVTLREQQHASSKAACIGHEFVRGFTVPMHGQQVTRNSTEARSDCIQLDLLKGAVRKGVHHVVGP